MKHRWMPVLAMAVAAVLAAAVPAGATTKSLHDAQGDSQSGHADIKDVTAKPVTRAVLFTISSYTAFKTSNAPCVGIYYGANRNPPGDSVEICGNGKMQDFAHGGGVIGQAKVTRPNAHTVVYRVSRSAMGHPKTISWQIQVRDRSCSPSPCDQAPNPPGRHVVESI